MITLNKTLDGIYVKINSIGQEYVESLTEISNEKGTKTEEVIILKKLEEIKDWLKTIGLGQEIIFEEIDELKDNLKNLNKKNWIQLLKGKLIDFGISEVLDKETINKIYNYITNTKLELHF